MKAPSRLNCTWHARPLVRIQTLQQANIFHGTKYFSFFLTVPVVHVGEVLAAVVVVGGDGAGRVEVVLEAAARGLDGAGAVTRDLVSSS